jgi:hypothetical protein
MNRVMPNGIWHQILVSQGPGNSLTLNHWQGMVQCDAKWTGWCQMAFGIKCSLLRGQGTIWLCFKDLSHSSNSYTVEKHSNHRFRPSRSREFVNTSYLSNRKAYRGNFWADLTHYMYLRMPTMEKSILMRILLPKRRPIWLQQKLLRIKYWAFIALK